MLFVAQVQVCNSLGNLVPWSIRVALLLHPMELLGDLFWDYIVLCLQVYTLCYYELTKQYCLHCITHLIHSLIFLVYIFHSSRAVKCKQHMTELAEGMRHKTSVNTSKSLTKTFIYIYIWILVDIFNRFLPLSFDIIFQE